MLGPQYSYPKAGWVLCEAAFSPGFHLIVCLGRSPTHFPLFLRETLVRLQLENKRLCQQEAADRERQEELQRHLEEANRARHGLEAQQR